MLQDSVGGWQSPDTAKAFADYAGYVSAKLSDRVRYFFTINEFSAFVELGYGSGVFAPGLGEADLAGGAVEKPRPEALLNAHDMLADHRRGHVEALGRTDEASRVLREPTPARSLAPASPATAR